MNKRIVCLFLLIFAITGCSADLQDYSDRMPRFNLFQYFEGETLAWGMVQDYSDKQTRRFSVTLSGRVDGKVLTLTEDFLFDDGEESRRIWVITRLSDGRYTGRADDIVGEAKGSEVGNALRWEYDFELQVGNDFYTVFFDDWLYRQDEYRVFNLTSIKKFGIEVAKITLFFEKQ